MDNVKHVNESIEAINTCLHGRRWNLKFWSSEIVDLWPGCSQLMCEAYEA